MKLKNIALVLALAIAPGLAQAQAADLELPPFLPAFYSTAFQVEGNDLGFVRQSGTNNVQQCVYAVKGKPIALSVECVTSGRSAVDNIFGNVFAAMNKQMATDAGQFLEIAEADISAAVREASVDRNIFIFKFPGSVQIWTLSSKPGSLKAPEKMFDTIKPLANRQRYAEAMSLGNVTMGAWGPQIHAHARALMEAGKTKEAQAVLKNLLVSSPYNFEAHMDFVANTDDLSAATNSARVVLENAETPALLARAARFLGVPEREWESAPVLSTNDTGFQVILVPLPPCSPWFLNGVTDTFSKMTDIPVSIRRLGEEWRWGEPDRIAHERAVQDALRKMKDETTSFAGWTRTNYVEALRSAAATEKAFSKYVLNGLLERIEKDPGQYMVDPYLDRFCNILKTCRSTDKRTMYVGITEADIYSGDSNFLFSQGRGQGNSPASILSYHMMLAGSVKEDYESQQRLVERTAKELVPASFKQLDIPRSTDPRCPYSYSSGVSRLDEKALKLSEPLKQALEKLRLQESAVPAQ